MGISKISSSLLLINILLSIQLEILLAASVPSSPLKDLNLKIPQGQLKGSVTTTRGGRHIAQYLGIPYVTKPARFQLAGPAPKWDGVRDARQFGSKCIQYRRELNQIIGTEDCLFLNVFTPKFPESESGVMKSGTLLPVKVFIHGGSFLFYSGEVFGPKYLLDEDVILVTFNYRTGALGFLNTEERGEIVPNLGLKDQVSALEWVRSNIEYFGGNKDKVTIMGNSAGSASVSYHVLSPLSKNLFNSAISQSGVASCPWAFVPRPANVVRNLAEKLGCPTNTTKQLTDCLKSKSAMEIVTQQQKILGTLTADPPVPFAPSAENYFVQTRSESAQIFLPDSPDQLLAQGKFNIVPYIIGINSADGLTFAAASILNNSRLVDQLDRNWDTITPAILAYSSAPNPIQVAHRIREFYFGKDKISVDNPHHLQKLTELLSDRNFFQCSQNFGLEYSKQGAPTYLYYFSKDNGESFLDHFGPTSSQKLKGAKHQDEIQYLTTSQYFPEIGQESKSYLFSQKMIGLWNSFGNEGKPSKTWANARTWNPLSEDDVKNPNNLKWYHIDDETKNDVVQFGARVQFWNSLPLTLHKGLPPFIVGELRKSSTSPPSPINGNQLLVSSPTPLTIGHSHQSPFTAVPPIVGTSIKSTLFISTVTTLKPMVSQTPLYSHVFPGPETDHIATGMSMSIGNGSLTTTKSPGILSKLFGK